MQHKTSLDTAWTFADDDEEEAEDRVFLGAFDRIEARSAERASVDRRKKYLTYAAAALGCALGVGLFIGLIVVATHRANVPWSCPATSAQYNVTFFVIGDWGRQGNSHQLQTAHMMADVAGCMQPAFIISTGDNFYDHGLTSATDPQIQASWRDVYSAPSLQVPWYATLGNHDYGNGIDPNNDACAATSLAACPEGCCHSPVWQYTSNMNDMRWHCLNGTYKVPAGPLVDIVMMDTSPFIRKYYDDSFAANAGGLLSQDANATKQQVTQYLQESTAPWKLVVGHHPIYSYGEHCDYKARGDCVDMLYWGYQLQELGANVYFCGHEHDLQYIQPDTSSVGALSYVVSGAGSDVRHNEFTLMSDWPPELRFVADDQGFVAVRVNETNVVLHYYTASKSEPSYTVMLDK